MPTTSAGQDVKQKLTAEYGKKKGKNVYYALQVKGKGGNGKNKWEGKGGTGKIAKAKATYKKENKKSKKTIKNNIKKQTGLQ